MYTWSTLGGGVGVAPASGPGRGTRRSDLERGPVRARALPAAVRDHVLNPVGVARRRDEAEERGRRHPGAGLVLRVELHGHIERVLRLVELDDVHALLRFVLAREHQTFGLELRLVRDVELVPVPVPLLDPVGAAVQACCQRLFRVRELHPPGPEPHVGAHRVLGDLGHVDDDVVLRLILLVELLAGRVGQTQQVAGELDNGDLHAEAHAQVGFLPLPCQSCRTGLPLDAPVAEAARHKDAVRSAEPRLRAEHPLLALQVIGGLLGSLQVRGVDPIDPQLAFHRDGGMVQRGEDGLVSVAATFVVLAHEGDDYVGGLVR
mmetsp:Transcript_61757/g.188584  ORF Transcript_61757/g.188584 Transcript_61757/m.188584 type:complete len:319 (-) Transcript_61757:1219-2175(-)